MDVPVVQVRERNRSKEGRYYQEESVEVEYGIIQVQYVAHSHRCIVLEITESF
jgi:hypothetical protein